MRALIRCTMALALGAWAPAPAAETIPERVVAVGGALTEIVYALGAEELLAGVDDTSLYPPEALKTHPSVGYVRALSAEPILSLRPDLLLVIGNAGPPEVLAQLTGSGLRIEVIPEEHSIAGVYGKIMRVADLLGRAERGRALVEQLKRDYSPVERYVASSSGRPGVLFLLSVSSGALLAAGQGTSAHSMIELAGGRNVTADFKGYKGVGPEAIIAAAPEFIIITQRTLDSYGGTDRILQLPDVKATPAAQNGRVISFDDMYLLGFGPRTVQAVRELAERLHGPPMHADRGVAN